MSFTVRSACLVTVLLGGVALLNACSSMPDIGSPASVDRPPKLDPDYTGLVIPPNIAPMNFRIREEGSDFAVRITGATGDAVEADCPDGTCQLDADDWHQLLQSNRGKPLTYEVFARDEAQGWRRFEAFTNLVAEQPIDSYIVFRQLLPNKMLSSIRGIFQRDLESFDRSALITLRDGDFTCFNCHTFHNHDPNRFLMHIRGKHAGMLLVMDGETRKVQTKVEPMFRPLAYASWHPNGRYIAATINMFLGHFPSDERTYYFEAIEKRGDLMVYDVETNTMHTTAAVFNNEYIETHPCWSPDGRYIYFVRGKDVPFVSQSDIDNFRFDLMRIAFDTSTETWGAPELVYAYSQEGKSCAFPRPSADGRYVLHILADRATYPIHQRSSDVYLLDLETKQYQRLDQVSSDLAESYPRWSSNGRWFSFVSNRRDGMSALPYFAYFDGSGQAHKAFVLPQEDPGFYDTFYDSYNVLEMVRSRVNMEGYRLAAAMAKPSQDARFPNPPHIDAYTGATQIARLSTVMSATGEIGEGY